MLASSSELSFTLRIFLAGPTKTIIVERDLSFVAAFHRFVHQLSQCLITGIRPTIYSLYDRFHGNASVHLLGRSRHIINTRLRHYYYCCIVLVMIFMVTIFMMMVMMVIIIAYMLQG